MKPIVLSAFLLLIFSCQKQNAPLRIKVQQSENLTDENFEVFFNKFIRDSTFQVSRVNFPIKVIEFDTSKLINDTLTFDQSNYNFQKINKKSKDYTIEKVITSDSAKVLLKGIDNGIYVEFYFTKKNGNWKLNTWTDSSTNKKKCLIKS